MVNNGKKNNILYYKNLFSHHKYFISESFLQMYFTNHTRNTGIESYYLDYLLYVQCTRKKSIKKKTHLESKQKNNNMNESKYNTLIDERFRFYFIAICGPKTFNVGVKI